MRNPYIEAIERRMDNLRAQETYVSIDPASARSETVKKGEWLGSAYEFQLFSDLLKEFKKKIDKKFNLPDIKVFAGEP